MNSKSNPLHPNISIPCPLCLKSMVATSYHCPHGESSVINVRRCLTCKLVLAMEGSITNLLKWSPAQPSPSRSSSLSQPSDERRAENFSTQPLPSTPFGLLSQSLQASESDTYLQAIRQTHGALLRELATTLRRILSTPSVDPNNSATSGERSPAHPSVSSSCSPSQASGPLAHGTSTPISAASPLLGPFPKKNYLP